MSGESSDDEVRELLVERPIEPERRPRFIVRPLLAILGLSVTFAMACALGISFSPGAPDPHSPQQYFVATLYPIGWIALLVSNLIRAHLNLVVDPQISSAIAAVPVFLLALPIGCFYSCVIAAIVFIARQVLRRYRSRASSSSH